MMSWVVNPSGHENKHFMNETLSLKHSLDSRTTCHAQTTGLLINRESFQYHGTGKGE